MLVIGVSVVSFWKSLSATDFQAWFASHSHLIGRLMIPLGVGGVAVTVAAVIAYWRGSVVRRRCLLTSAVSAVAVMITYPLFFAATNEAFVRDGLSDFSGAVLTQSMGGMALDSYWTWGARFCRGITSASWLSRPQACRSQRPVRSPTSSSTYPCLRPRKQRACSGRSFGRRPLNRRDRRLAGARPALLDGRRQDGQRARAARRQRERHGDPRVGRARACGGASDLTRPFASTGAIPRRSPTSGVQD